MTELRLLSIEDDINVAALICRVAQESGFAARTAFGTQIEKAYEEFQPDVIVLDIMMPDMDGIEVLQYLRERCCRSHIVIMSGSDGLSRRIVERMGNSLGFTIIANMTKPFRVPALRAVFEETKAKLESAATTLPQKPGDELAQGVA